MNGSIQDSSRKRRFINEEFNTSLRMMCKSRKQWSFMLTSCNKGETIHPKPSFLPENRTRHLSVQSLNRTDPKLSRSLLTWFQQTGLEEDIL